MVLEEISSGEQVEATIEPLNLNDFKVIKRDKSRFDSFNWNAYKSREVYKLRLVSDETILGLMCLTDHPGEGIDAIEIELLEVSLENRRGNRKFALIAGCLIAFACRESFKRGYEGWVFLKPKTYLKEHYSSKYGFVWVPIKTPSQPEGIMELNTNNSLRLIKRYID
ncbi:hypothetical protein [Dinghuibacter silviterrae]|uniref:N-acetyltransferase domain-containing protein n=1 Tax=Dinghuibacter silviterrae TaxID=1539049 RepID=A0A4R8DIP6_9BACT|nr:hypothetical protein [Dinghuibacter silviterrae]TDW97437.1 hypothetical protein EDB95_5286 [Dinghuibacter silviterrae]